MSKQVEKSILGLLVAGAMLITLGAGVVAAETHPHVINGPVTTADESVADPTPAGPDIYADDASVQ